MEIHYVPEPELEFGGGGTHVDARFGLMQYGSLDEGGASAPGKIRVAIIGTNETVDAMRAWLERGKSAVEGKESRLRNLFPAFPGFSERSCFKSELLTGDKWSFVIPQKAIDGLVATAGPRQLAEEAAGIFMEGVKDIGSRGGATVLLCVPPQNLSDALDHVGVGEAAHADETPEKSLDLWNRASGIRTPHFEEILKARAMKIGLPVQLARPGTYTGQKVRRTKKKVKLEPGEQDEATRAWNFYLSLYLKAGGVPWGLPHDRSGPVTCFTGISFYRTPGENGGATSVAAAFDERGEGNILRGGKAKLGERDGLPHLSADAARSLLRIAIKEYRKVHVAALARVVVQKMSTMDDEEIEGFSAGAKEERVKLVDLLSVSRSNARLFRGATYPPLRGTFLQLEEKRGLVYLDGSVNFFQTYPGLHVPQPLEFFAHRSEAALAELAREILQLSKLGWNGAEFGAVEPITLRAAGQAGGVLKNIPEEDKTQLSYRYFM